MRNGKDVEYLIILDTEGLYSPKREDLNYDNKIVMFALLCSDFLIINTKGDMTLKMKELIRISVVNFDYIRANQNVPKILFTYV